MLELESVTKAYGNLRALKEVSLRVAPGEWLSVMGPSGSGKTTLMNLVGCLDTPTSGRVVLDGVETNRASRSELTRLRRDTVGLVFQRFHLVPHLTALENIMVAQYYHSLPDAKQAMEALERVGLADRAKHLPRELSGGEQQRVCVARALINYPKLVLADEPVGNLDEDNERRVLEFFAGLHADGTTLVVVTHDPKVAALGQRTIVLEHGRIAKEAA
ncbi:MAG: ABC transporter ATP-binding protein [Propionibacteriaceae bacterium]|jgi:putative ABC transport system ATP-binding protein|nr:ABC transporter ATP-binding protein [Propionibacteriaceae bacterium]